MTKQPHGAGKSSFDMTDAPNIFELLKLKNGDHLLDLGCGRGDYSLAFAPLIAPEGKIIAVDLWEEGIKSLSGEIQARNIKNIEPKVADVTKTLPVEDGWADICFSSTVLHDLIRGGGHEKALEEMKRILKPDGVFVVIEFQKVNGPPGPSKEHRIAPEELRDLLFPYGFEMKRRQVLGRQLYFAEFFLSTQ